LAEDADDLVAFRARKDVSTVPFEDFVRELERDEKIWVVVRPRCL